MAVSMLAWPVMMTTSVSGDTCLSWSRTSMPFRPGMRRSRMAASNFAFSRALTAALPSAQTVTSWPRRGSSARMNSWSDFSSSANRMRRALCGGAAKRLLLDGLRRLHGHAHREGAPLARAAAGRLYLSSVLAADPVADRQPQSRAFPRPAAREERLEDVLQHVLGHAAAGVGEGQLGDAVGRRGGLAGRQPGPDRQRPALVHAVQGV